MLSISLVFNATGKVGLWGDGGFVDLIEMVKDHLQMDKILLENIKQFETDLTQNYEQRENSGAFTS